MLRGSILAIACAMGIFASVPHPHAEELAFAEPFSRPVDSQLLHKVQTATCGPGRSLHTM